MVVSGRYDITIEDLEEEMKLEEKGADHEKIKFVKELIEKASRRKFEKNFDASYTFRLDRTTPKYSFKDVVKAWAYVTKEEPGKYSSTFNSFLIELEEMKK